MTRMPAVPGTGRACSLAVVLAEDAKLTAAATLATADRVLSDDRRHVVTIQHCRHLVPTGAAGCGLSSLSL